MTARAVPPVRAWRIVVDGPAPVWLAWAPSRTLALLNARGAGMAGAVVRATRLPSADGEHPPYPTPARPAMRAEYPSDVPHALDCPICGRLTDEEGDPCVPCWRKLHDDD
jgi:hypothetical protein